MRIDDLIGIEDPAPRASAVHRAAGVLAWSCMAIGFVSLLAGAASLASADLGTELRARGCVLTPLPGLALFVVAGVALALAPTLLLLRTAGAVMSWDARSLLFAILPALVAAAALPGVLGCSLASQLADVALIGGAITGVGALVLAPAALVVLGVAVTLVVHVSWAAPGSAGAPPPTSVVEQAMLDAEALAAEQRSGRFHGVDSSDL